MLNLQEERRAVAERPRRSDKLAMAVARVHYSVTTVSGRPATTEARNSGAVWGGGKSFAELQVLLADPTVSQIEEEEHQDTDEAAKREPLMDIPTTPRTSSRSCKTERAKL